MSKFVIIDGNSVMNRTFYGLSGRNMLSNKEGIPTNALYGFLAILFKIISEDNPTHIAVAFDLRAPTFRHIKYDKYKANRKGMPEELAIQMPLIKEILDAMNIHRVEIEGFEADDILGTLSKKAQREGYAVVLFTGDRDAFQLIEENIHVKLPSTKGGKTETEEYDVPKIEEKYGITPKDLIEVKGLMGDASDNIPGVRGIGEKTALAYIQKFGTIEKLYDNLEDEIVKPKAKEMLTEYKQDAFMSRDLATIKLDISIEEPIDEYKIKEYQRDKLYDIFTRLEFNNFIKKLGLSGTFEKVLTPIEVTENVIINTIEELEEELKGITEISLYIDRIQNISSIEEIKEIGICVNKENNLLIKLKEDREKILKCIFENEKIKKTSIDTKTLFIILKKAGIAMKGLDFDIGVAKYVLNSSYGDYTIDKMAHDELGIDIKNATAGANSQMSFFGEETGKEVALCAKVVHELRELFFEQLKANNQIKLFYEIEMPLIEVLADMQIVGIKVEESRLKEYSSILGEKMEALTKEIIEMSGEEFNINSPKQLGEILFNKLKLKSGKKTQSGYSTDADTLNKLKNEHPIIEKILEYKQYTKLKSTYADGLANAIDKASGRIHSNFNQTITVTGRLSSTEPNLQNIPIKLEAGQLIRGMFVAEPACVFIDADYSQIELRVLAHMAQDREMIAAFNNDEDIHTSTAMEIFNVEKEQVTPMLRSKAKAVNFGIVYGQGEFSLSEDLKITRKEAKKYIDAYFEHFSGIKNFMQNMIKEAEKTGYAETIFSRRRYLPDLKSSNFHIRAFAQRVAMNMPIQGSAADIIKIAMIEVNKKLKDKKSKLVLQVHDELIVEAPVEEVEEVSKILKKAMEEAVALSIKLKVDLNTGKSWLDAK